MKNLHTFTEFVNESLNEAKELSRFQIDAMGKKLLGKIKLGTQLKTDNATYAVVGYGPKANAYQEYDVEKYGDDSWKGKVKLTAMYGVKLEVSDDPRSAVYRREEPLKSIVFESQLNEADMTRYYDGFKAMQISTKKAWQFRYRKGKKNTKVEQAAFDQLQKEHGVKRNDVWVGGFIPKGEWTGNEGDEVSLTESELTERAQFEPPTRRSESELKKMGAEWWFKVPFNEFKSRALGKPNFVTSDNVSPVDAEIWWTKQAFSHDGSAHAKILKMLDRYKGDYKGAGENWEKYKSWIENAMIGQGNMIDLR